MTDYRLHGAKVKSFMLPGWEYVRDPHEYQAGREFDSMEYHCANYGDHGLDYIYCFKNGEFVKQFNVRFIESVEFAEGVEPLPPLDDLPF